jgi:serine/threonine protein kinase
MSTPQRIGRYQIQGELGRGGLAIVYRAHDSRANREVALKVLPRAFMQSPSYRARFEREAKAIASLKHPAIVPLYDYGEENVQFYFAMRYMRGGALPGRIADGPMPVAEVTRILRRIAPALDHAHSYGVLHRNLRAGSVLFDEEGEAYLSDFGIVTLPEVAAEVPPGVVMETLAYMSPEQIQAVGELDERADTYALGVILYEMLTGERPYWANNPQALGAQQLSKPVPSVREALLGFRLGSPDVHVGQGGPPLPRAVDEVVAHAMAKDPSARYPSGAAMLNAWESATAGPPARPAPQTTPPSQPQPAPSKARRQRDSFWVLLLVGLGVVPLVLLGLVLTRFGVINLGGGFAPDEEIVLTQTHRVEELGFSVGLPEGWLTVDSASFGILGGPVQFTAATEDQAGMNVLVDTIEQGGLSLGGPTFIGMVMPIVEMPDILINPRVVVQLMQEQGPSGELTYGRIRNATVSDEKAAYSDFTFDDPETGESLAGRMVAVVWSDQAGVFFGVAPQEDWEAYAPTFDAMMSSVELFEPSGERLDVMESIAVPDDFPEELLPEEYLEESPEQ